MRSQTDKSASRRTSNRPPNRPPPPAPPAAILEPVDPFSLCWRDRAGRVNRQSFETADDLLAALDTLRSQGDVRLRGSRGA